MTDFHPCTAPCYRCEAATWELVGEFVPRTGSPQDVVACAFCGARLRVKAAWTPPAERRADADDFRFQHGRFKGLTFAEADAQPNGRRYLEVMRDTSDKLRDRIKEYLSTAAPSA